MNEHSWMGNCQDIQSLKICPLWQGGPYSSQGGYAQQGGPQGGK